MWQACAQTAFFFNAQKVGPLPASNNVPWRANALTNQTTADGASIAGALRHLLRTAGPGGCLWPAATFR